MIGSYGWSLVAVTLASMVLAAGCATWAAQAQRSSIIADRQFSLDRSIQRETDNVLSALATSIDEIASNVRTSPLFQAANTNTGLSRALNQHFEGYPVSAGHIQLVQLYLYDSDFVLQAYSSIGPSAQSEQAVYCQSVVDHARRSRVADEQGVCRVGTRPFYARITPVSHGDEVMHLLIVADPLPNLTALEAHLRLPLKFDYAPDEVGYRSPLWLPSAPGGDVIESRASLSDYLGAPALSVAVQQDISGVLQRTRIIGQGDIAGITLVVAIMVVLTAYLARRNLKRPLTDIADHLLDVSQSHRPMQLPQALAANPDLKPIVTALGHLDSELTYLREAHQRASVVDHLTALPNRVLFRDRLEQLVESCRRRGERFALLLLDVDGFKDINATFGHDIGDRVLSHIAERLLETLRTSSTVARLGEEAAPLYIKAESAQDAAQTMKMGGDEFALLLPGVDGREDAMSVAQRIGEALALPVDIDDRSVTVTATLGVALYPNHGETVETLLSHGYAALSQARATERGVMIYREAHDIHLVHHRSLPAELSSAIRGDELDVAYLPKLALAEGRVVGVEALVRWPHPRHGVMLPEQFVSLAEQRGLIQALTDCVLHRALAHYKAWRDEEITWPVAVNISQRLLYDSQLPERLMQILEHHALPVTALSLDISEQAIIVDPHRALAVMDRLNEMGIALSIDNFGTGYSSLGFLKNLPIDEIKIDSTFVMDMKRPGNDAKIVHATIDLAHNLDLNVVAEGVDDETTLTTLKDLNCDYGQGFAICPPMAVDELTAWSKAFHATRQTS